MKNDLTELVFILDRSGSMSGLEKDTIGGFNAMLARQKKEKGRALVSTVLFDDDTRVLHDRVDIQKVRPMTEDDYFVGSSTALLDAMGGAIHHIAGIHKRLPESERPSRTVFVITTDGQENSSRIYSRHEVKAMVQHEQEIYGGEFLFLGANMDAIAAARSYGIREDNAVRYECDATGTALNFEAVSMAVECVRGGKKLDASWKAGVEKDFKKRGHK